MITFRKVNRPCFSAPASFVNEPMYGNVKVRWASGVWKTRGYT